MRPAGSFRPAPARLLRLLILLLLAAVPAGSTRAIATNVAGVEGTHVLADSSSWAVRVHDVELFEIPGLHAYGIVTRFALSGFCAGTQVARVSSPVGSETTIGVTVGRARAGGGHLAVTIARETATVGTGVASLTSASVDALVHLSRVVLVSARVERVRIAGIAHPGADVVVGVEAGAAAGISIAASVRLDRRYGSTPGLCIRAQPVTAFVLRAGLEDSGGSTFCDVTVRASALAATAGAWWHEVLGVSRGVSLLWTR